MIHATRQTIACNPILSHPIDRERMVKLSQAYFKWEPVPDPIVVEVGEYQLPLDGHHRMVARCVLAKRERAPRWLDLECWTISAEEWASIVANKLGGVMPASNLAVLRHVLCGEQLAVDVAGNN